MEFHTSRGRVRPTKRCRDGERCNIVTPSHFYGFTHSHLEKILNEKSSDDNNGPYKIPSEFKNSRNIIIEQLKIIDALLAFKPLGQQNVVDVSVSAKSTPDISSELNENVAETERTDEDEDGEQVVLSLIDHIEHLNLHEEPVDIKDYFPVVVPKGEMAEKLEKAAPYNFFLTAITAKPETHSEPLSITFQEIFDPSLGEIECTVQITFLIDLGWLLAQYHFAGILDKPLLLLHGYETPEMHTISQKRPQITVELIELGNHLACHHSKIMLLGYTDKSMRVVVSTANLYQPDWHIRTQGLWISPRLYEMDDKSESGESPTGFRNDLLQYLASYKNPNLEPWLKRIQRTNFSAVNVFLITSVPGLYGEGQTGFPSGHCRVGYLLSKHSAPIEDTSPVVAQSSSIGSFMPNAQSWLIGEFTNSLRRDSKAMGQRKIPEFRLIYPSLKNVLDSHTGLEGGSWYPYSDQLHQRQTWLESHMFQWKADGRFRSEALPHIKTYARWTEDKLHWFILTSANMSKAAWGVLQRNRYQSKLSVFNYEAGVLFIPKFVTGGEHFPLREADGDVPAFPMVYDVPLTPYEKNDCIFRADMVLAENQSNSN